MSDPSYPHPDEDLLELQRQYGEVKAMAEAPGMYVALERTAAGGGKLVRCDRESVYDVWMYPSYGLGELNFKLWDGFGDALDGWVRHTTSPSAHRRRVNGDPKKEYRKS